MSTAKAKSAPTTIARSTAKPGTKRSAATERASSPRIQVLQPDNLAKIPWLVEGFSTRLGGYSKAYGKPSLNLGVTRDDTREAVAKNRAAFQKKLGAVDWPLVQLHQVHSDVIHNILDIDERGVFTAISGDGEPVSIDDMKDPKVKNHTRDANNRPRLVGDGLITTHPGILLAIKTADCMPVILADTKRRVVGVFHAGWRGTLLRIAEKGVGEMRRWFGSRPEDIQAALGPSIRSCCYSVGEEVRDHFRSQFAYADELFREWQTYEDIHLKYPLLFLTQRAPGHSELPYRIFLDLAEANRRQLLDAGLPAANIAVVDACTGCDTKHFFSHRKENGLTGRLMSVVGIRPEK